MTGAVAPVSRFVPDELVERAALDYLPWTYESPAYEALGFRFRLRSTDQVLGQHLGRLWKALESPSVGEPAQVYSLIASGIGPGHVGALYLDEQLIHWTGDADVLFRRVLWHLNQSAIRFGSAQHVLLHAGVVELDGVAALLVAPENSGKTTLTAALVRRGLGYLSDELAPIVPSTGEVVAFPKPLSIDPGSWEVLGDLRPTVAASIRPFATSQWQVPAADISPGSVRQTAMPAVVLLPRYVRGASVVLQQVPRAEALVDLAKECFTWSVEPRRSLSVAAAMLRGARAYRLTVNDLQQACDLVIKALRETP